MSGKERKFYVISFIDPRITFLKDNFKTKCNENAYSDIV